MEWQLRMVLLIITSIYCAFIYKFFNQATKITRKNNGEWYLQDGQRQLVINWRGDSIVTKWITVLRFQTEKAKRPTSRVVFCDSMPAADYRTLLMLLH